MTSSVDDLHRNLMINFIPLSWDSDALQAFFSTYGPVESSKVVVEKGSQRSKGFGFVKFVSRNDAENCIATAQGLEVEGKKIKIQKAELGKGPSGSATVYIAGFDNSTTGEAELQALMSPYGTVTKVLVHTPRPGMNGVAFVTFQYFAEAQLAVENLQGRQLGDKILTVRIAEQTLRNAQAHGAAAKGMKQGMMPAMMPFPAMGGMALGFPGAMMMPQMGMYGGMGMQTSMQPFAQHAAGGVGGARFHPYKKAASMQRLDPTAPIPPNGQDGSYCVFVYGIKGVGDAFLRNLVAPYGTIVNCHVPPGKNFGFVNMPVYAEAVNVVNNLNGAQLPGLTVPIQVSLKQ